MIRRLGEWSLVANHGVTVNDSLLRHIRNDAAYFDGYTCKMDDGRIGDLPSWRKELLGDHLSSDMNKGIAKWRSGIGVFKHLVKWLKKSDCVPLVVADALDADTVVAGAAAGVQRLHDWWNTSLRHEDGKCSDDKVANFIARFGSAQQSIDIDAGSPGEVFVMDDLNVADMASWIKKAAGGCWIHIWHSWMVC